MIAWVLVSPFEVIPVIGAEIPGHLEASVQATEVELSESEVEEIRKTVSGAPSADVGFDPPIRGDLTA